MSDFEQAKNRLLNLCTELASLFDEAKNLPGITSNPFASWQAGINQMRRHINEGLLRVAVVGAIKSGKSTFLNAFLGAEHLRRGAGVLTSIVTRIHTGGPLCATLSFKSIRQINDEINRALVLFPGKALDELEGPADIGDPKHRAILQKALDELAGESLISSDTRNPHAVVLASLLEGFEEVRPYLKSDSGELVLSGSDFDLHRDFVSQEKLASYLSDIALTVPEKASFKDHVEFADCQGSDSPNPMHLAKIEEYLLKAHLIIYVVSSRTGLRQADIRFLSLLRQMGLDGLIYFVLNCDLTEHSSLDDLIRVNEQAHKEIELLKPEPQIFAFSALYTLFGATSQNLTEKDRARLEQWRAEKKLLAFVEEQQAQFIELIERRLTQDRKTMLLQSHADRLAAMAAGLSQWMRFASGLAEKDSGQARGMAETLDREAKTLIQVRSMIRDTLDGSLISAKKEMGIQVDRFLDMRHGDVVGGVRKFINDYTPDLAGLSKSDAAVSTIVYAAFQNLKNAVDGYLTHEVNPAIIRFVRTQEKEIQRLFENIGGPFGAMVREAVGRYNKALQELGLEPGLDLERNLPPVEVEQVKRESALAVPPLATSMQYAVSVRTEAVMRSGWQSMVRGVKGFFKLNAKSPEQARQDTLSVALSRMKKQTEESLMDQFLDYRENLKYQYVFKLMDRLADSLWASLFERFKLFTQGSAQTFGLIEQKAEQKQNALKQMDAMQGRLKGLLQQLEDLRTPQG
ncbi:MAG: dynamin family protein [Desulfatibacillaceae bacterium]|nr:dynamin family protein [Desulfatibacillaceae bacterium]